MIRCPKDYFTANSNIVIIIITTNGNDVSSCWVDNHIQIVLPIILSAQCCKAFH